MLHTKECPNPNAICTGENFMAKSCTRSRGLMKIPLEGHSAYHSGDHSVLGQEHDLNHKRQVNSPDLIIGMVVGF